ncbi:RadC family protein [Natronohydrobacter thiooxidans]|uniref:RadC family protein n=1 Tax=Natronohydrobacter thiooxidans TaxID=87172 RepID=UPI0008FF7004|nr:DNA repair protein RadC [Natronohydrobacter thiooxidans]
MRADHASFTDQGLSLFAARPAASGQLATAAARRGGFVEGSLRTISDCDLLEMLLSDALPDSSIGLLAQRLLDTFGDLNRVVAAAPVRLRAVPGMSEAMVAELKLLEACAQRMARARILNRPIISNWNALLDYCHTSLAHRETEQFRVLFLDRKNVLIADLVLGDGTVDHVPVYPREILRQALELNASALILVHNHPSGDPTPSEADIAMTQMVRRAAEALSITVHDHLIIGHSREISLRSEGLL